MKNAQDIISDVQDNLENISDVYDIIIKALIEGDEKVEREVLKARANEVLNALLEDSNDNKLREHIEQMGGGDIEIGKNAMFEVSVAMCCKQLSGDMLVLKGVKTKREEKQAKQKEEAVKELNVDLMEGVSDSVYLIDPEEEERAMGAYIPSSCPEYYPRTIAGMEDIEILRRAYENRQNILLLGDAGAGKTLSLRRLAWQMGVPYTSVSLNGACSTEDLIGTHTHAVHPKTGEANWYWINGWLTKFVKYGGIFVAEEINATPPEILFILHEILERVTNRLTITQLGTVTIPVHPDFVFCATMNPGYEGTVELNKALKDRFDVILEYDYDEEVEANIVENKNLLKLAKAIRALYPHEISTPCSTRMLKQYADNTYIFGSDVAREIFINNFDRRERETIANLFMTHMGG